MFLSVRLLQDSTTGTLVTLRIDPNGFYLYWVDQNKVGRKARCWGTGAAAQNVAKVARIRAFCPLFETRAYPTSPSSSAAGIVARVGGIR